MARQIFVDNFLTTLLHDVQDGDTHFSVADASKVPAFEGGDYLYVRIGSNAHNVDIQLLGRTGNTFACEPIPGDWDAGSTVAAMPCRRMMEDILQRIAEAAAPHVHVHTQSTPATPWTVAHNLGYWPSVTVFDEGGSIVDAEVVNASTDLLYIHFSIPFAGTARCE